jgi:hypothetical protein
MTAATKEVPPPTSSEASKLAPFIVYMPPKDPIEAIAELRAIEKHDEAAIIADLQGRAIDRLFYELSLRGQLQVALSWPGVKYFTLGQGHISIEQVQLSETTEKLRAIAWALDKQRDVRVMGAAEQSKLMTLKDGTKVPDEFALPKVVSKAQRNALRSLIPETLIAEAYKAWKNRDKTPSQSPTSAPSKPAAKPTPSPSPAKQAAAQPTWTDNTQ